MTDPYRHPQQGGQWPAGPPGGAAIAVTAKYFWLGFFLALFKPVITIDGYRVAGGWGRAVVPVAPGQHLVHAHVPYFLPPEMGPADLPVTVQPGQTLELEYRAPLMAFVRGSLGSPPQRYNGAGFTVAILGVVLLLVFCAVLVPLLSALSGTG